MPITSSAKKALRASERKRVYNVRRKRALVDAVKAAATGAGGKGDQKALIAAAYKAIDKAAKGGTIKKNTASRKKARVARMFAKAGK